jgi:hypothetical protein
MICRHIPNPPALVGDTVPNLLKQQLLDLSWRELLGDQNQVLYCQKSDRILIVRLQSPVYRQRIR